LIKNIFRVLLKATTGWCNLLHTTPENAKANRREPTFAKAEFLTWLGSNSLADSVSLTLK
jgi:hypothetical protein